MTAMIPVKYVGKKETGEVDHLYGTKIVWSFPGEVKDVPENKVPLLLNHPDVWQDARTKAEKKAEPIGPKTPTSRLLRDDDNEIVADVAAKVHLMDKPGLVTYALTQFGERLDIDNSMTREQVLGAVVNLINTRE
jgi:hypothetical protein